MNCRLRVAPVLWLAVAGLPVQVNAQQPATDAAAMEYSVEAQLSKYKYEEPGLMELKGNKGEAAARATRLGERGVFTTGEIHLAYGKSDYSSNGTGSSSGVPDFLYEFRGLIGKRFSSGNSSYSPYFGIGWRHLINDSSESVTTTGYYGYKRVSDYYYLPLGIDWKAQLGNGNYAELNAEYDLLLRGTQQSHLRCGTVKQTQNRGHGLRGSALYGFGPWAVGPFAATWRIADSTLEGPCGVHPTLGYPLYWIEPKNTTTEAGIRVRYTFQ